jgi:hypothetical protein
LITSLNVLIRDIAHSESPATVEVVKRAQELTNQLFFTPMSEKYLPSILPVTFDIAPSSPHGVTQSPSSFVTTGKRKFIRKIDFPARDQWLKFLGLACTGLFNPYMPNRSGTIFSFHFLSFFNCFTSPGSKKAIVEELASTLVRFLFGGRRCLMYRAVVDDDVVTVNLSFPDEKGDFCLKIS